MQLVILSGPPRAGKSATAAALCARYDRMLHIDVEVLRGMLRMGRARVGDDSPAAEAQRRLFIDGACDMARRFLDGGYGVVIDDVITPDDLAAYREALSGIKQTTHFVVLLPALDVLIKTDPRQADRTRSLHERFASWESIAVVDPDELTPELVADRVMSIAAEGRALLQLNAK